MTNAAITKTINKVEDFINKSNSDGFFHTSLGFARLICLPVRVRKSFNIAANMETDWNGRKAHDNQVSFLGRLSDVEFANWLKAA